MATGGINARGGVPVRTGPMGGAAVPDPPPAREPPPPVTEVPDRIYDPSKRKTYVKGRFLGKGGFARCYEVTDIMTEEIFACKVVNKTLLVKPHQRDKMAQEITIHRGLGHDFVVNFVSYFEDDQNVYIILELCGKKSLMELQKRRRVITEPEARYFLRQIVLAVDYLHNEKNVIHRDLKLGNIFITDDVHLKIGDFGLATQVSFDGERKRTLCGTPNYIAPEVLAKKGHSYEVDVWSIGCILYTLLVGKPPFETATLRDTYHKIRRGEYERPRSEKISQACRTLLQKMLQVDPTLRPTTRQILQSEFLTQGLIPHALPGSVLTTAPRFEAALNTQKNGIVPLRDNQKKPLSESNARVGDTRPATGRMDSNNATPENSSADILELMRNLRRQMLEVVSAKPPAIPTDDDSEEPTLSPLLWICKWVDYSDKYGFGYQLSDDSIGVSFNDQTKVILLSDAKSMHYIEKTGDESYYTLDSYPTDLQKKVKLLNYFQQYMKENLLKASGGRSPPDPSCIARLPNLWTWFRTSRAVVMVLSNGTLQINNFRDHTKMVICPLLGAISTLSTNKELRTFKLSSLKNGCSEEMEIRLKYAIEKLEVIIGAPKNGHGGSKGSRSNVNCSPAKSAATLHLKKMTNTGCR